MTRRFGFKPSDHSRAVNAALKFYASASERPDAQAKFAALLTPEPPLRSRRVARAASELPLEAEVVRAVGQLLAVHPRILWACRFNSGAASYEHSSGRCAPVWFNKWVRPSGGYH